MLGAAGAGAGAAGAAPAPTPLSAVLDPDALVALVREDASLRDELLPHLPEGQRDLAGLVDTLRSPQLMVALDRLSEALEQGGAADRGADSALASFGLDPRDGRAARARGEGAVGALVAAIIAEAERRGAPAAAAAATAGGGAGGGAGGNAGAGAGAGGGGSGSGSGSAGGAAGSAGAGAGAGAGSGEDAGGAGAGGAGAGGAPK